MSYSDQLEEIVEQARNGHVHEGTEAYAVMGRLANWIRRHDLKWAWQEIMTPVPPVPDAHLEAAYDDMNGDPGNLEG